LLYRSLDTLFVIALQSTLGEIQAVASLKKAMFVVHVAAKRTISMIALSPITGILVLTDLRERRVVQRRLRVSLIATFSILEDDKTTIFAKISE
jgi:hypothetical protein